MFNTTYYPSNGIKTTIKPSAGFYIEEVAMPDNLGNRLSYYFDGDDIFYDLDSKCVDLYDVFTRNIFADGSYYEWESSFLPMGITEAGNSAESPISKDAFEKYFTRPLSEMLTNPVDYFDLSDLTEDEKEKFRSEIRPETKALYDKLDKRKFKDAYLADCHNLISTLQDLIQNSKSDFILFYKYLAELEPLDPQTCEDDDIQVWFSSSPEVSLIVDIAQSIIVKIASALDILTKICYELEHIQSAEGSYPRLASRDILYQPAKIKNIDHANTVFDKSSKDLCYLLAIRNEIVHNASWEVPLKEYVQFEQQQLKGKWIFMPDATPEGTLVTYRNRKHFFSQEKKLNEELPRMYLTWMGLISNTLYKMKIAYDKTE